MAQVKYGGGIVQMSGSIAGNTFARNRFGNYMRARTKPINPKSSRQMGARTAIMFLAEQWREDPMNDDKREAWETYAKGVNWHNKLGEVITLTGFNMFIRGNAAILRCGGTIVTDGPADIGLPPGDPSFVATAAKAGTKQITYVFDDTFDWCGEAGGYLSIHAGCPQNPTRNFFGGPWRFERSVAGSADGGAESPMSNIPFLSWTLVAGQKLWFEAQIIRADGRSSTMFAAKDPVIVAA